MATNAVMTKIKRSLMKLSVLHQMDTPATFIKKLQYENI
jgi:hypothetical protein